MSCTSTNEVHDSQPSNSNPHVQSELELSQFKRATALLNRDNIKEAKEMFLSLTKDRPELAGPYANLAIIALKEKEPEKAIELVGQALRKNPNLPEALNMMAYLEQIKGNIRSAENYYKRAIDNNANYSLAHYNLALLYDVYLQDIESAIAHYERYMELINNEDKNTADWLEQIKRSKDKS